MKNIAISLLGNFFTNFVMKSSSCPKSNERYCKYWFFRLFPMNWTSKKIFIDPVVSVCLLFNEFVQLFFKTKCCKLYIFSGIRLPLGFKDTGAKYGIWHYLQYCLFDLGLNIGSICGEVHSLLGRIS